MAENVTGFPDWFVEFLGNVNDMRTAQKNYFKYRSSGFLRRSVELEGKVDEWLKQFANKGVIALPREAGQPDAVQQGLF